MSSNSGCAFNLFFQLPERPKRKLDKDKTPGGEYEQECQKWRDQYSFHPEWKELITKELKTLQAVKRHNDMTMGGRFEYQDIISKNLEQVQEYPQI